jgi:hypothetical protein
MSDKTLTGNVCTLRNSASKRVSKMRTRQHLGVQDCTDCSETVSMGQIWQWSSRKLTPPSELKQSSCHRSRQPPHWIQSSSNVSPHPAQAADEGTEIDGLERPSFRFVLFFVWRPPDFSFFCAVYNPFSCRSVLPFILLAFASILLSINVL